MADQLARDLEKDLGEVKAETVSVMAEEKRAKRAYDEGVAEVEKLQRYAEKAVLAGNDADAKVFLSEKAAKAANLESLKGAWDLAAANAAKMRQMHDKLVNDKLTEQLKQVEDRKAAIRAKAAMVKSQQKANEIKSDLGGSSLAAFDALEEKLNRKLDEAEAAAELNTKKDDMADLMAKYDDAATVQDNGVEDELAALKAKLGK